MKNLVFSLTLLAAAFSLHAQDPALEPFYHGVASGDALSDRVIIWTRVTYDTVPGASLTVNWRISTDTLVAYAVQSGSATTDSSKDYTVKVDVTGLQPDTWYYYQFSYNGKPSLIGRTKTLPVGNNQHVRFAVVSCESYSAGVYYNAWLSIATRNDIEAVVHLGDYIYESGETGVSGSGVNMAPDHDIMTVEDYRERYNCYRLDPYLRRAHQQYPFYNIWDDHEVANNSWTGGSSPATPGDYQVRKANAQRAYFEWIPIREQAPGSHRIYRTLKFGDLADLIMLDTRHEGRNMQVTTPVDMQDTNRTILGVPQRQWLFDQLDNSQASWRIIGQQVMIAPLVLGTVVFNNDQWDGYEGDRNRLIDHVINNNIENVVVLTGDIHSSWANDIPQKGVTYNPATGAGSAFVEYVTTSITSGGLDATITNLLNSLLAQDPYIKYSDVVNHGYSILDIDTGRVQSDWYFVSSITSASFTTDAAASWYVKKGERFLRQASSEITASDNSAAFAPQTIYPVSGVREIQPLPVSVFPNPFGKNILVELKQHAESPVVVRVFNIHGRKMYERTVPNGESQTQISIDTHSFPAGDYLVTVENGNAASQAVVTKAE